MNLSTYQERLQRILLNGCNREDQELIRSFLGKENNSGQKVTVTTTAVIIPKKKRKKKRNKPVQKSEEQINLDWFQRMLDRKSHRAYTPPEDDDYLFDDD